MASFKDAAEYVNAVGNTNVTIPNQFDITPDGIMPTGTATYNVREVICALLAGNGIKLPNLQICLKINIGRLIPALPAALAELRSALLAAEAALDAFIAHTGIDAILDRINGAIGEIAAIANMLNFCGTPVNPRPIPNVLDDMFGSFTGAGHDILDGLGKIADSDIGGCLNVGGSIGPGGGLVAGVNFGIFTGGALKDLGDLISDIENNVAGNFQARIDSIKNQLNGFANDMENLIEFENNYANRTVEPQQRGGSTFVPVDRIHKGVGARIPEDMDMRQAENIASSIKYAYKNIGAYKVKVRTSPAGVEPATYEMVPVMELFLEPELVAKLEAQDSYTPTIGERKPILDYCGKPTGEYEEVIEQSPVPSSTGGPKEVSPAPGSVSVELVEQQAEIILQMQAQIDSLTARLDALESGN